MPIPEQFRPRRPGPSKWVWIGLGGLALVGGFLWYRNRQSSSSSSGASQTITATAPTLDSSGYLSGVTDTSNNLPFEDTWPYNQLALPYNYNSATGTTVASNANYLLPNQPNFVGNQVTTVG